MGLDVNNLPAKLQKIPETSKEIAGRIVSTKEYLLFKITNHYSLYHLRTYFIIIRGSRILIPHYLGEGIKTHNHELREF